MSKFKVDKDIYDYIKNNVGDNGLVGIVAKFHKDNNYNVMPDEMIEFCQALKAYPDIEPIEELYYVKFFKNDSESYLNYYIRSGEYMLSGKSEEKDYQTKFTGKQITELGKKEGKDFWQFAVKVEE